MTVPGISGGGRLAESRFLELTGAVAAEKAALGDALLDGHYVEIKQASRTTLNQVRAVKYILLVAYFVPEEQWYVVPANEVVRQCASKERGQHTENPFESATLNLNKLAKFKVDDAQLREEALAAIAEAAEYPRLHALMESVLAASKLLAKRSVSRANVALADSGLAEARESLGTVP